MTQNRALGILISPKVRATHGPDLRVVADQCGVELALREFAAPRPAPVEVAFLSREMLVGSTMKEFTPRMAAAFRELTDEESLKWLHMCSSGVDFPAIEALLRRGVRVTTSSGANAEPMAQTAILGVLAISRGLPRWVRSQAKRHWNPAPEADWPDDLGGQTMTLVGAGPIGREIARLAKALRMRVVMVRRRVEELPPYCDEVHGPETLAQLASRTDWLVLAAPLTAATRGLVSRAVIARLPRRASVVNVARGEIVDEEALIAALTEQRLLGAFLDVFSHEPLHPDSPLWDLPNVIISPHNAALAKGNEDRQARVFIDNLSRYLREDDMINEVHL